MPCHIFGYGSRCISTSVFASVFRIKYVIIIFLYNYTYNRVISICIDLSKIKLFVFEYHTRIAQIMTSCVNLYHPGFQIPVLVLLFAHDYVSRKI